jgi:trehalose 6-phosphate synthase/phosphatase
MKNTVQYWADSFLSDLDATTASVRHENRVDIPIATAVARAREAAHLELLLDYDGTLVPLAPSPELAYPDPELLALLEELASAPNQRVHIVSGRPRDTLDAWFGASSLSLWAEHGFWARPTPTDGWQAAGCVIPNWMERIRPLLDEFTRNTPGSFVEQKSAGLAWHYRLTPADFGRRQAHELRMLLGDALSNQPFEVLEGKKVVEVRLRGVSKAVVAYQIHAEAKPGTMVIAIGDDRTDDDLFRELPPTSVTIGVGEQPSHVKFRVRDSDDVRALLRSLVTSTAAVLSFFSYAFQYLGELA